MSVGNIYEHFNVNHLFHCIRMFRLELRLFALRFDLNTTHIQLAVNHEMGGQKTSLGIILEAPTMQIKTTSSELMGGDVSCC